MVLSEKSATFRDPAVAGSVFALLDPHRFFSNYAAKARAALEPAPAAG
jgi:hypothetical protein